VGFGFVDNVDLHLKNNMTMPLVHNTINILQLLLDEWELDLWISRGTLSAAKSHWTAIDFKWIKEKWVYKSITLLLAVLTMQDMSGRQKQLS